MTDPNSLAIFAKVVEASSISGPGLGLSLRAPRVSSKNSKANGSSFLQGWTAYHDSMCPGQAQRWSAPAAFVPRLGSRH
jgi:hypothetical protein